jgi:hypothetical protein
MDNATFHKGGVHGERLGECRAHSDLAAALVTGFESYREKRGGQPPMGQLTNIPDHDSFFFYFP